MIFVCPGCGHELTVSLSPLLILLATPGQFEVLCPCGEPMVRRGVVPPLRPDDVLP